MLKPRLYSEGRRTLGKEVVVSWQVMGWGSFFYLIHQTGADLLNEAKASLTDKNPILAHEKRRRGGGGCRKWEIWKEEWKRAGPQRVRCRGYFKFYPQQLLVAGVFNGSSPLFSFYTRAAHPPRPRLPFMQLFAVYGYTEIPLCRRHTLFRKVT